MKVVKGKKPLMVHHDKTMVYDWYEAGPRAQVDVHMPSGTTPDMVTVSLDDAGTTLILEVTVPRMFYNPNRLQTSTEGTNGEITMSHSQFAALEKKCDDLKEIFNFQPVFSTQKIKLPYKCENNPSTLLGMYEHDYAHMDEQLQYYYMLHVKLVGAKKRKTKNVVQATQVFGRRAPAPAEESEL